MIIYLTRHGETEWNKKGILMGQTDIPLNETGKSQAKILKEKLKDIHFDICFSSPLKRARETAEIICGDYCQIIDDDLLKELFCGDEQGKTYSEINWNGETVETSTEIMNRAKAFLTKISQPEYKDKVILVVSHNGLLNNLRHCLSDSDKEINYETGIKNCDYEKHEL